MVLIDIDDTLLDTSGNAYRKHREICEILGVDAISWDDYRRFFGKYTFEDFIKKVLPGVNVEDYKQLYDGLRAKYPYVPVKPDLNLLDIFYALKKKGML